MRSKALSASSPRRLAPRRSVSAFPARSWQTEKFPAEVAIADSIEARVDRKPAIASDLATSSSRILCARTRERAMPGAPWHQKSRHGRGLPLRYRCVGSLRKSGQFPEPDLEPTALVAECAQRCIAVLANAGLGIEFEQRRSAPAAPCENPVRFRWFAKPGDSHEQMPPASSASASNSSPNSTASSRSDESPRMWCRTIKPAIAPDRPPIMSNSRCSRGESLHCLRMQQPRPADPVHRAG